MKALKKKVHTDFEKNLEEAFKSFQTLSKALKSFSPKPDLVLIL
jgi:hypothetical protein